MPQFLEDKTSFWDLVDLQGTSWTSVRLRSVHIDTSTSSESGFRFTARASFTRKHGVLMVNCTRTTQCMSTNNLLLNQWIF